MIIENIRRKPRKIRFFFLFLCFVEVLFLPVLPRGKKAVGQLERLSPVAIPSVPPVIPYAPAPPTEPLPAPTGIFERFAP
jgi:hypothetical protein